MDCYANQSRPDFRQSQPMTPPPCGGAQRQMTPPVIPQMAPQMTPQMMPANMGVRNTMNMSPNNGRYCPGNSTSCFEQQFTTGMAYVPWQQWNQTYNLPQGLSRGTIFPELDKPFSMGRCR